ncbi:hypothetical protein PCIT_a0771 [Pseudoalteromonas citrea]|uniref:Uncharacterized protein n=1 Tax=Pseudoalteromonas citrea TaxID=43655 RepID=A0AAD4FT90_9GAMM|nr:hypothetical protein PCIT_a0771 [Pseudoalteromonas citrea]
MKLEKIKQSLIVRLNWDILRIVTTQGEILCQLKVSIHTYQVVMVTAQMKMKKNLSKQLICVG